MVFLLSAGSLVSLVFVGHAAMDDGWFADLHEANDAVHILAASGVDRVPDRARAVHGHARRSRFARRACATLIRFSTVGHVAVALVLLTGVVNTYLVLGRWPFHLASLYQVLLLGKVALAFGMVALALMNRYAVVPKLRARGAAAIADLRRLTIAELGLGSSLALVRLLDPT